MVAGKARLDVTTIDSVLYALALAYPTQAAVALPHVSLDAWPSLIVEHLVMLRSESFPTPTLPILHRTVANRVRPDTPASLRLAVDPRLFVLVSVPHVETRSALRQSSCASLSVGGWKSV